jgi:hypothetical protein
MTCGYRQWESESRSNDGAKDPDEQGINLAGREL